MVKFCSVNRFGIPYAYYEIMCTDCNWMGEIKDLVCDDWGDQRLCPQCGSDDTDEFDDVSIPGQSQGFDFEEYIHLKTEWGSHEFVDSMPKLIWKFIIRKLRRIK